MATDEKYYYGTGKRKTSIARVRLYSGKGGFVVNDKSLDAFFPWDGWRTVILAPLKVTNTAKLFNIVVKISGGGVNSQAEATRHGISRALVVFDEKLKPKLKERGFLTRDAREKESKKYGLKGARKAKQYTKR